MSATLAGVARLRGRDQGTKAEVRSRRWPQGLIAAEAAFSFHFFYTHSVMSPEGSENAGRNAVRVNWSHLLCLQTQIFCVSVCHHNSSNKALVDIHLCFCSVSSPAIKRGCFKLVKPSRGLGPRLFIISCVFGRVKYQSPLLGHFSLLSSATSPVTIFENARWPKSTVVLFI